MKFYRCKKCHKIMIILKEGVNATICCNEGMEELKVSNEEYIFESHFPLIMFENKYATVQVGDKIHPNTLEHHIEFIAFELEDGVIIKYIKENEKPLASIRCDSINNLKAIYAYCNIHGLWKNAISPIVCL